MSNLPDVPIVPPPTNPFYLFVHSRKFWTFILTAGANLILYFATKYLAPTSVEDVKMVLAFVDGLAAIYIGSIAWEDGKRIDNGMRA